MRLLFTIGILFIGLIGMAQTSISPEQLLNKAINFHDPQGNWTTFQDSLQVVMTTPNAAKRTSHIYIDLPKEFLALKQNAILQQPITRYLKEFAKCTITIKR